MGLSDEQKLLELHKFTASPWFAFFILNLRKTQKECMVATMNSAINGIGDLVTREQVIGENKGLHRFELDYLDSLDTLKESIKERQEEKDNPKPKQKVENEDA